MDFLILLKSKEKIMFTAHSESNLMFMKDCHTFQNMFWHFRGYRNSGLALPFKSCTWILSRRVKQFDPPPYYYPAVSTEASRGNAARLVVLRVSPSCSDLAPPVSSLGFPCVTLQKWLVCELRQSALNFRICFLSCTGNRSAPCP